MQRNKIVAGDLARNIIIVHGAYGYPTENWFDWLKQELIQLKIPCYVPQLPTPKLQTLNQWLYVFNDSCGDLINENTILIGHSLGAVFLLRWLELYSKQIQTTILIGTFLTELHIDKFDAINQSFICNPFQWEKIRHHSKRFICYHGVNDPYVPRWQVDFLAKQLQARKILLSNAGHINQASGYSRFPQLLFHLKQYI